MSQLTELIAKASAKDPQLGTDLSREFRAMSSRLSFGLNFERHRPEAVELPQRPVRRGDKVRVLPARGSTAKSDPRLWLVRKIVKDGEHKRADLELLDEFAERISVHADDLVVVAEFRDTIYPGLVSTGRVSRGGDKPWHTVINGENYHVLKALTWTHRGKVDAIYIDPPYNTGAKDWKYNNDYVEGDDLYRHSKWLAMMERRLLVAKELLNPADSVLIVTIDEKEYLRLGLLLEQVFPEARIQMVSTLINPASVAKTGYFGRSDEYYFYVMIGGAGARPLPLSEEWVTTEGRTHKGQIRWDLLRKSGSSPTRAGHPETFYAFFVTKDGKMVHSVGEPIGVGASRHDVKPPNGTIAVWPIRQNGSEGRWRLKPQTVRDVLAQGCIRIGDLNGEKTPIYYLAEGERAKVTSGAYEVIGTREDGSIITSTLGNAQRLTVPGTQWRIGSHDATQYGTRLLLKLVPDRKFPFPKSLYAVEDALRFFLVNKPTAIVLDFFAGSGTTAHAVMRLNRQYGGKRQCISVTNNEVGADEQYALRVQGLRPGDAEWEKLGICDFITKPRVRAVITGKTPSGDPIEGEYQFGKVIEHEKPRTFKQIGFTESNISTSVTKKKQLVALINGLPQSLVKDPCHFIVSQEHTSSILFDTQHTEDWLEVLDGQDQITDFYIVTAVKKTFDAIKQRVADLLGPIIVKEVEKFPMSDGFEENAEFYTLTYETPVSISYQTAFERIAPLLWLRAGSAGRRIEKLPAAAWEVVDHFGLLVDLDKATDFLKAARKAKDMRIAYIVTDDERRFQAISRRLPDGVEAVRLYESYLTNFAFANGDDA
jgi:adenine-specific DNA-methyltransferase